MSTTTKPATVQEYIDSFSPPTRTVLQEVRRTINDVLPDSEETIRYGIAAVMSGGRSLVHYAGWKHHIGLYPIPRLEPALEAEVAPLRAAKDTMRLPLDERVPYELIRRVVTEMARMRSAGEF